MIYEQIDIIVNIIENTVINKLDGSFVVNANIINTHICINNCGKFCCKSKKKTEFAGIFFKLLQMQISYLQQYD